MSNFQALLGSFSSDNHTRGKQFEVVCKWFLETDPHYANRLEKVWLWEDWPGRWGADCGIDLIAKDGDGKLWAIQAKCYDPSNRVTKQDIDKFLSESTNEKIDFRLLIATTDQIGGNARNVIKRQNRLIPFNQVLLNDLEKAPIVWPSSVDELGTGHIAKKATPRPHQIEAIEAATTKLLDRGQMIMACGTGKTLTALWLAEKLESKRTLVLLPSLLLLSKTLADWVAQANEPFAYLPVCSDETVARNVDSVVSSTAELAFPSTTDTEEICSFLRKRGTRVVFSTYQSSPKIAEAFKQGNVPHFDLVIADEAHRCAGKVASEYGTVLDNDAIPAKKRLFMTATPRVYTPHLRKAAENSGFDVASMDDEAVFGPVLHKLTFGQAIELDLLSDYQVVVVGIDDSTYSQMVDERRIVETETGITANARSLASHVGLAKAMDRYDLRRLITFHSRVKWASQFATELREVVEWMPEQYRPDGKIMSSYVSGDMSTSKRNQRLASLAEVEPGQRAVLANARCLSEGVDVPALDGVAFIDPRKSEIDIVQAVGRAIRLSPDKLKGAIIIPVFISDEDDPDTALSGSEFSKVWTVVNALRAHDDALGEELDSMRTQLGKRGSTERPSKIVFDIPTKISNQFASAFDTRLVEATTASWHFWFGLLETYIEQEGIARVPQGFKTAMGYSLGSWVSTQRMTKDKLSPERFAQLESLPGWVWDLNHSAWEEAFEHLEAFVKLEGPARVPSAFKSADGFALGGWVSDQRKRKSKDKLSPERIARLESIPGWVWDLLTAQWEDGFDQLETYSLREGNVIVPSTFRAAEGFALGSWVSRQRALKAKLSAERIARLEARPGWTWDLLDAKWEEGFGQLEAFVRREGNSRVPDTFKTENGFRLGRWIGRQRKKKDLLSLEQLGKLESLPGWSWNPYGDQWAEGFLHLQAFQQREGHASVPDSYKAKDDFSLGRWVQVQRKTKDQRSPEQIDKLEALPGWNWDVLDARWEDGYSHLKAFVEEEGHARVPQRFTNAAGYNLGTWTDNQRRNKSRLSPMRINSLEAFPGWEWSVLKRQWEVGYGHLRAFVDEKGHTRVPASFVSTDGYRLGAWLSNQRSKKDKLTLDQIGRIEALPGWTWDINAAKWQEGFEHLEAFVKEAGHAGVPDNFQTKDGYQLRGWVNTQRANRTKMLPERVSKLESLSGWEWDLFEEKWERGFAHLEAFVAEEGHARVVKSFKAFDGYALGDWIGTQRRARPSLSLQKIARLEALSGWAWDAFGAKWDDAYSHLEAFTQQEGHARVPRKFKTADGFTLGNWIATQRKTKSKRSPEQIEKLELLPGWVWDVS